MTLTGHIIWCIVISIGFSTLAASHSSVEEALQINRSPAKKYRKKLRKEEGAIRLVGGSNDYEGKTYQFRHPAKIKSIQNSIELDVHEDTEMAMKFEPIPF